MRCKWCESKNTSFRKTPESIHYGRWDCMDCKRFICWAKNPDKPETNRKVKLKVDRVCQFHNLEEEQCFFCQRKKEQLGWNETLTVDHIKELDKGGKDKIENMQVLCTACHKLKNWARLYMNWHFNEVNENDKNT